MHNEDTTMKKKGPTTHQGSGGLVSHLISLYGCRRSPWHFLLPSYSLLCIGYTHWFRDNFPTPPFKSVFKWKSHLTVPYVPC